MSALNDAHDALADALRAAVLADPIAAHAPAAPVAWAGYVWQATEWIRADGTDGTFCPRFEVGLVFDLVASVADLVQAQRWINDRVAETLVATGDGVEVLPGEFVEPVSAEVIGVVRAEGAELFAARVEFSPFTLEVS